MKRASLFALAALSFAVVLGCPSQPPEKGLAALAANDCCQVSEGTRQVDLTVSYDPARRAFTIKATPDVVYLSTKFAKNNMRWRLANMSELPADLNALQVSAIIDGFQNPIDNTDKDPFPGKNSFSIGPVDAKGNGETGDSEVPGKKATYKYNITFDFVEIDKKGKKTATRIVLDPRVVVGD